LFLLVWSKNVETASEETLSGKGIIDSARFSSSFQRSLTAHEGTYLALKLHKFTN